MVEETTQDGLTTDQIDTAYAVLEVLRESFNESGLPGLAATVNEAHYLVQQYENNATWSRDYDTPEVGEIVHDPESPNFGSGNVEVVEVTDVPAHEYTVETTRGVRSIARLNPGHPADAPVVVGVYTDGGAKEYSFPSTRLEF